MAGSNPISDKLAALGVQLGSDSIETPARKDPINLEADTGGAFVETRKGRVFRRETKLPLNFKIGRAPLIQSADFGVLGSWIKEPDLAGLAPEDYVFLDTEASGLATGPGTFITWFTAGRFIESHYHVFQVFLYDIAEEPAFLQAIDEFVSPAAAVVTYNGKSFDGPLIQSRYAQHHWPTPLQDMIHVDLVHLARRLWRDRLPERRLMSVEESILHLTRPDDVPGYMVPEIYREYAQTGRTDRLEGVFRHNHDDVISLAALLFHMAKMLENPLDAAEHEAEYFAIGKMYEELNRIEEARALYEFCLDESTDDEITAKALNQLSFLHKRRGDVDAAIELWKSACEQGRVYAHVELAKVYEHQTHDLALALAQTEAALALIGTREYPLIKRYRWKPELDHRLQRLKRKLAAAKSKSK
jgi:hypothetical protein